MNTKDERVILNRLIELNGKICRVKGCSNKAINITLIKYADMSNHDVKDYISVCKKHLDDTYPFHIKKGTVGIT